MNSSNIYLLLSSAFFIIIIILLIWGFVIKEDDGGTSEIDNINDIIDRLNLLESEYTDKNIQLADLVTQLLNQQPAAFRSHFSPFTNGEDVVNTDEILEQVDTIKKELVVIEADITKSKEELDVETAKLDDLPADAVSEEVKTELLTQISEEKDKIDESILVTKNEKPQELDRVEKLSEINFYINTFSKNLDRNISKIEDYQNNLINNPDKVNYRDYIKQTRDIINSNINKSILYNEYLDNINNFIDDTNNTNQILVDIVSEKRSQLTNLFNNYNDKLIPLYETKDKINKIEYIIMKNFTYVIVLYIKDLIPKLSHGLKELSARIERNPKQGINDIIAGFMEKLDSDSKAYNTIFNTYQVFDFGKLFMDIGNTSKNTMRQYRSSQRNLAPRDHSETVPVSGTIKVTDEPTISRSEAEASEMRAAAAEESEMRATESAYDMRITRITEMQNKVAEYGHAANKYMAASAAAAAGGAEEMAAKHKATALEYAKQVDIIQTEIERESSNMRRPESYTRESEVATASPAPFRSFISSFTNMIIRNKIYGFSNGGSDSDYCECDCILVKYDDILTDVLKKKIFTFYKNEIKNTTFIDAIMGLIPMLKELEEVTEDVMDKGDISLFDTNVKAIFNEFADKVIDISYTVPSIYIFIINVIITVMKDLGAIEKYMVVNTFDRDETSINRYDMEKNMYILLEQVYNFGRVEVDRKIKRMNTYTQQERYTDDVSEEVRTQQAVLM